MLTKKWQRVLFSLVMIVVFSLGPVVQANNGPGRGRGPGNGDDPGGPYTEQWDRRGTDSLRCDKAGEYERPETGWIHWVFSTKGASTEAELVLGGTGSGTYAPGEPLNANVWHFYTPYFDLDGLTAEINLTGAPGPGGGLVISDYCPGVEEKLTVTKTADTSFTRKHLWDIEKSVDTGIDYTYCDEKDPWVVLCPAYDPNPRCGDQDVIWTVDVTYEGYRDSAFKVSGEITIENTGHVAAVITAVDDVLAGTSINVNCGVEFPHTLAVGETLTCTYSEDGYVEGENVVTVTTERKVYTVDAEIIWSDDPTTELYKTVTIVDDSDLFGEVELGTVTAPEGAESFDPEEDNPIRTYTYTQAFAFDGFPFYGRCIVGDFFYYNTASIIAEDGTTRAWDTAKLVVSVWCW